MLSDLVMKGANVFNRRGAFWRETFASWQCNHFHLLLDFHTESFGFSCLGVHCRQTNLNEIVGLPRRGIFEETARIRKEQTWQSGVFIGCSMGCALQGSYIQVLFFWVLKRW